MSEYTGPLSSEVFVSSNNAASIPITPEIKAPEVGDTMTVAIRHWGHMEVITDRNHIQSGDIVTSLEVKEVRKAKITLE